MLLGGSGSSGVGGGLGGLLLESKGLLRCVFVEGWWESLEDKSGGCEWWEGWGENLEGLALAGHEGGEGGEGEGGDGRRRKSCFWFWTALLPPLR